MIVSSEEFRLGCGKAQHPDAFHCEGHQLGQGLSDTMRRVVCVVWMGVGTN